MQKKLEIAFKNLYLLFVLISFNSLFARQWYIPYLSYVIVGFGAVVGVMRLIRIKDYLNAGVFLLLSFVCSYILGAVNSVEYGYIDNVKAVVWMAIQYFLIFAFDKDADVSREKNLLFKVLVGYTGIAAVVSLYMMITNWQQYDVYEGIYFVFGGFIENRLWGTYIDPNYGAVMSIVSILISVFFLRDEIKPNKLWKCMLIANIVVEFLYICYSDSRTGMLAIITSSVIFSVLFFAKSRGWLKSLLIGIAACMVIIVAIKGVQYTTSAVKVELAKITATRSGLTQEEIAAEMDQARVGRVDEQIGGGSDVTNNRFAIWGNAIEMFKQHPIVGISFRNINEYAKENIPDTYVGFESMHNFFFDILVSQGIIGVAILFMLMGWVIWTLIKKFKSLTDYREFAFMMAIIAAIFASMLTYSETFYMNTGGAFIFWYVLGYLVNYKEKDQEKTKLAEV